MSRYRVFLIALVLGLPGASWAQTSQTGGQAAPVRRIGGGVTAPKVIYSEAPEFSDEAKAAHVGGNVLVYLEVDPQGKPQHVRIIRGVGYGLDEKALEAVRKYRFEPATENGVPVTVAMNVEVNFVR